MRKLICLTVLLFGSTCISAQELFPHNEPASNIPKGTLGVREFNQSYKEFGVYRNLFALRLMYGVLSKLTIAATASISTHHDKNFPPNLVSHTHSGNQTIFSTGNFQRGVAYPYLFTGIYLYAKYRFLTLDGENKHIRMALYGEWSNVNVAHDETEPNLLDDTKGYGSGFIVTGLKNHWAASLTAGAIIPGTYNGFSPDPYGGPMVPTELKYGKALQYNLSIGYLLLPFHYESYKQTNLNLYIEFMGKAYQEARVYQYGDVPVPIQTPLLQAGNYIEAHPGIQAIFNSNTRVDFTVGFPLINRAYTRFYPVYMLGVQRYFYFR